MLVQAPHGSIHHKGLSDVLSAIAQVVAWVAEIAKDSKTVENPNESDAARAAAYLDFAAIAKKAGSFSGSAAAQAIVDNFSGKLQTYLQSIVVTVPGLSKDQTLPLNYQGHQATLWELVNAINSKDGAQDFSASTEVDYVQDGLTYQLESIEGDFNSWANPDQLQGMIQNSWQLCSSEIDDTDTRDGGIRLQVWAGDSCGEQQANLIASASVTTWINYATASATANSAADLNDLDSSIAALSN